MDAVPPPTDLSQLSAYEARALIRAGHFTSLELVQDALARIAARDGELRAWVSINPTAEAQAAVITADDPRPLAGIPVAVKDMIDTHDMPSTNNAPLSTWHHPATDAPCVALLRAAGAIILGKTDSTEFAAAGRNASTGNPRDIARTSGGSSAGTAAAVADAHVPLGLGTQTGGSTIRPASFCGAWALKPTWGLISTEGVRRYSTSLDTLGLFARGPRDLGLLADLYRLPEVPDLPDRPLRIGLTRTPFFDRAEPETHALFDGLPGRLDGAATLVPFELPPDFADVDAWHRCVMLCESATGVHSASETSGAPPHGDFPGQGDFVQSQAPHSLWETYDRIALMRMEVERRMAEVDLVIAPSALGFAPIGRGPGNPVFNAMWTALKLPVLNLPVPGLALPLGISLVTRRGRDRLLIAAAARLAKVL